MPQQLPDGRYLSDDGSMVWNGTAWAAYIPPAPPPPPAPMMPPPPPAFVPQAPASGFAPPTTGGFSATDMVEVKDFAWSSSHPIGKGFVALVDDVEWGETKNGSPQMTMMTKTLEPNGSTKAGYKGFIRYPLTTEGKDGKSPAVGRLFTDLVALKMQRVPNPATDKGKVLVAYLRDELRGKTIVYDVTESLSSTSDLPNFQVKGFYSVSAPSVPQASAMPPGPPPAPMMPSPSTVGGSVGGFEGAGSFAPPISFEAPPASPFGNV